MTQVIEATPGVREKAARRGILSEAAFINKHSALMEQYDSPKLPVRWLSDSNAPSLQDDYWRACAAVMMDNTRKLLVPESNDIFQATEMGQRGMEILGEATTPLKTTAWSGATTLPMVLGLIRKIMPRLVGVRYLAQVQPIDRPTGRIFFLRRIRHSDGTDDSDVENRAGWSYRSFITDPGEGSTITTTFKLELSSKDVTAVSRKYLVESTIESEQDLRAYFGLDAVALISDAGAAELATEIDEFILNELYANYAGPLVQYGAAPSGYSGDNEAWDQRIMEAIYRTSELIYNKKRVRPNRLVIGSEFAIYLKRLRQFQSVETNALFGDQSLGVRMVGTLDGQFTVLQMPQPFPVNDAMFSYQGGSPLEGTFIWAPYVPLMQYSSDLDPATMVRKISWLRRDAHFTVDKGYVGLARIAQSTITGISYPAYTEYVGTWETSGGDVT
jgi:hypothetical protein